MFPSTHSAGQMPSGSRGAVVDPRLRLRDEKHIAAQRGRFYRCAQARKPATNHENIYADLFNHR